MALLVERSFAASANNEEQAESGNMDQDRRDGKGCKFSQRN